MGRARWTAWTGGAAAIAVASFACRQLVGIGDAPPAGPVASDDAGVEAGFTYGQGDCAVYSPLTLAVKPLALDGGTSGTMPLFARDAGEAQVYAQPTP